MLTAWSGLLFPKRNDRFRKTGSPARSFCSCIATSVLPFNLPGNASLTQCWFTAVLFLAASAFLKEHIVFPERLQLCTVDFLNTLPLNRCLFLFMIVLKKANNMSSWSHLFICSEYKKTSTIYKYISVQHITVKMFTNSLRRHWPTITSLVLVKRNCNCAHGFMNKLVPQLTRFTEKY